MNNWPLFEQRYAPKSLPEVPGYQDTLVALLIVMLLLGTLFWGLHKRHSHKQSSIAKFIFSTYAILQSVVVIGLLYAHTLGANGAFWQETGRGILYGVGYFLFNTLLYTVSWYVFGSEEHIAEWFGKYFSVWGLLGFLLFIPLFIAIESTGVGLLFIVTIGVIYLLFRIALLVISLNTFPKLRKYPLHIILYLCTCEIAPLLFFVV